MALIDDPVAEEAIQLPAVESPYAGRKLTTSEQTYISAFWFATNFLWGALLVVMLPGEIKHLAPFYRVTALSVLTGLAATVALIVPLVVGALSDRCASRWGRRRPFIAFGIAINVVGLIMMALTLVFSKPIGITNPNASFGETIGILFTDPGFLIFLFSYVIVQFGNNTATAAYSGIIPDLVSVEQRGSASGYMALMSQAGTLFGAVGCGFLLDAFPESVKYAVVCVVLVGVSMITVLGIKETPLPYKPPKIEWGHYIRSLWIDPRKYPDFAWVWITRALVMLGFYAILPLINYYLMDVVGSDKPGFDASILTGIILIASSVSGVYGGYISDRIGRKKVVYLANSAIAVMVIAFIFCRSLTEVGLAGVLFGLGFGAYTSVDWALGTDVLPSKKNAAKEMAVWHIAMTLPQSIAAPLAGYLVEIFGKTVVPAPPIDVWNSTVTGLQVAGDPSIGQAIAHVEAPEGLVHYAIGGYAAVFVFCAFCFGLGAYLLKNVRGVD